MTETEKAYLAGLRDNFKSRMNVLNKKGISFANHTQIDNAVSSTN
jgi:hypothetical protein